MGPKHSFDVRDHQTKPNLTNCTFYTPRPSLPAPKFAVWLKKIARYLILWFSQIHCLIKVSFALKLVVKKICSTLAWYVSNHGCFFIVCTILTKGKHHFMWTVGFWSTSSVFICVLQSSRRHRVSHFYFPDRQLCYHQHKSPSQLPKLSLSSWWCYRYFGAPDKGFRSGH